MDYKVMRDRISRRDDLVARLTHLTRGSTDDDAFDVLWKILTEKKLNGSDNSGYVIGDTKAVCFQEVPLYSIAQSLLYEDDKSDIIRYSWFGLRFNKNVLFRRGARPVIYGKTEELKRLLPPDNYWRIVRLDLDSSKNCIDWTHEREWRIKNVCPFEYDDIEVIVKNDIYYRKFIERCITEKRMEILSEIHGIVPLNTVIS